MHNFRKLEVYKRALLFSKTVRVVTRKFPKEELFALTSQFQRTVDSIVPTLQKEPGVDPKKNFQSSWDTRFGQDMNAAAVQIYPEERLRYADCRNKRDRCNADWITEIAE